MINKIKNDNLKFFLYKFFIVWNIFVIILLVFINIQINPEKFLKNHSKNNLLFGQLKLKWKSKFTYDTNLCPSKKIELININNDNYKDVISLNINKLIGYNGRTGDILFNFSNLTNIEDIKAIKNKYFLVFNQTGNIILYNNQAKTIWGKNLNTKILKISGKSLTVYLSNKLLYLNDKTGDKKRIVDVTDTIISVNDKTDINNDKINDIIFTSTNYISCIDGKSGKFLWHNKLYSSTNLILNVLSPSKSKIAIILKNKNNIIILNKYGLKIGQLSFTNPIKKATYVSGHNKKYFLFLDDNDYLYAYNIVGMKKEWEIKTPDNTLFVKNIDFNYDKNDELIIINSRGSGIIINPINSKQLDEFNLGNYDTMILSNILVDDIDGDSNFEIIFSDDKGYMYLSKYIVFKKKLFNLIINKILKIWK